MCKIMIAWATHWYAQTPATLLYSGPSLIRTTLIRTLANPNEDSAH